MVFSAGTGRLLRSYFDWLFCDFSSICSVGPKRWFSVTIESTRQVIPDCVKWGGELYFQLSYNSCIATKGHHGLNPGGHYCAE